MKQQDKQPYWETKSLTQMSESEWEALCDGCGNCCLIKLEDEDTEELFVTNVACHMLDIDCCRCRDYSARFEKVSTCLVLDPQDKSLFRYLPETCAYRCLEEGRPLPTWHPLITGNINSVHEADVSIKSFAVSEEFIHPDQLQDHIIHPDHKHR